MVKRTFVLLGRIRWEVTVHRNTYLYQAAELFERMVGLDQRPSYDLEMHLVKTTERDDIPIRVYEEDRAALSERARLEQDIVILPADPPASPSSGQPPAQAALPSHPISSSSIQTTPSSNQSLVNRIQTEDLHSPIKLVIREAALSKARRHANTSPRAEVGGILVGKKIPLENDPFAYEVEITDVFEAQHTNNQGASVTFTPDTWAHAVQQIEQSYAQRGECMLGWYHTHPGFGVFYSGQDIFFHRTVFAEPWQVGLVIDPERNDFGFFAWSRDHQGLLRYPLAYLTVKSRSNALTPEIFPPTVAASSNALTSVNRLEPHANPSAADGADVPPPQTRTDEAQRRPDQRG